MAGLRYFATTGALAFSDDVVPEIDDPAEMKNVMR
jgi:hypothetical protein